MLRVESRLGKISWKVPSQILNYQRLLPLNISWCWLSELQRLTELVHMLLIIRSTTAQHQQQHSSSSGRTSQSGSCVVMLGLRCQHMVSVMATPNIVNITSTSHTVFLFVTFIFIEQPRAQDNFEPDYCLRILHHPVKLVFSSSNCKLSTSNDFDANGCNKIHNPGLMYSKPPA